MKIDLMKIEVMAATNRKIDRLMKVAHMTDRPINIRNVRREIFRLQEIRNEWVDFGRLERSQKRLQQRMQQMEQLN
jgi:hypothetical protein